MLAFLCPFAVAGAEVEPVPGLERVHVLPAREPGDAVRPARQEPLLLADMCHHAHMLVRPLPEPEAGAVGIRLEENARILVPLEEREPRDRLESGGLEFGGARFRRHAFVRDDAVFRHALDVPAERHPDGRGEAPVLLEMLFRRIAEEGDLGPALDLAHLSVREQLFDHRVARAQRVENLEAKIPRGILAEFPVQVGDRAHVADVVPFRPDELQAADLLR